MQQTNNRIWYLMARKLSGEIHSDELEELDRLLGEDENVRQQHELLTRLWVDHNEEIEQNLDSETAKEAVSKIVKRSEGYDPLYETLFERPARKRRIRIRIFFAFAACGLIILPFILYRHDGLRQYADTGDSHEDINRTIIKEIATTNGSRTRTILKDGSTVWLNGGSKLLYENNFDGDTREVKLEGEAYFDIVKQTNRPFIVHTAGIDIRVLGTAFNVKSYPEDKTVETTLFRGIVQVSKQNDRLHKPILLKPNEKLLLSKYDFAKNDVKVEPREIKMLNVAYQIKYLDSSVKQEELTETAWVFNRLEFRGDNFEEVARKLERWYNVNIIFEDEKIKQLKLHGSFENETPEQAFLALQTAFPDKFTFKINGDDIYIKSFE